MWETTRGRKQQQQPSGASFDKWHMGREVMHPSIRTVYKAILRLGTIDVGFFQKDSQVA